MVFTRILTFDKKQLSKETFIGESKAVALTNYEIENRQKRNNVYVFRNIGLQNSYLGEKSLKVCFKRHVQLQSNQQKL